MVHIITAHRKKNIARTNIQKNIYIFNQIGHMQEIGNKRISLHEKTPTLDHIGDVVKNPLRYDWYDSIFSNYYKMEKYTTFSTSFFTHGRE